MTEKIDATKSDDRAVDLATFYVGEALCGMDILKIQEINKHMRMTKVPQAPEYITGILNLRGQIISVINLGRKLGLTSTEITDESRNIIVNYEDGFIGLLVDRISDVALADKDEVEPPPANIGGIQGAFFEGVFKTKDKLIGILDVKKVLESGN